VTTQKKMSYTTYGELAEKIESPIMISGRNSFHTDMITAVVTDVRSKLKLDPSHRLLEIGCNIGLMLTPLAKDVKEAVGVDHPSLLDKYRQFGVPNNVILVPGYWPEAKVEGLFDRMLVCSVMQGLPDEAFARKFVDACLSRLKPGGMLLLADLPNEDMRQRYLHSGEGKRVSAEYDAVRDKARAEDKAGEYSIRDTIFAEGHADVYLSDQFTLDLVSDVRKRGFDAFILPQPAGLPFYMSREDILIRRRD
jgi:SAM-dependent methyltransferase